MVGWKMRIFCKNELAEHRVCAAYVPAYAESKTPIGFFVYVRQTVLIGRFSQWQPRYNVRGISTAFALEPRKILQVGKKRRDPTTKFKKRPFLHRTGFPVRSEFFGGKNFIYRRFL